MRPWPRSIQGRLLALLLVLVGGVWISTAALTWRDVSHELDELLDSHLAQAAALLVAQQAGEIDDDEHGVDAPSLHRYAPRVAFQVFHEGRLALRSSNAPTAPMLSLGNGTTQGFRTIDMDGARWRVFAARGPQSDTQVFVGEQVESRSSILRAVLRSVFTPMLFALPLLVLAAWWAVRRGVAPMQALGRALAQRKPQALEPLVLHAAPAEMAPLLEALNGLLRRIAELMASERRFTADAAHELRTPLAAIRAQAQVALASADDAERVHALKSTLLGCDRAGRLVEQLLTLARLESGAAPTPGSLDPAEVVREVVAAMAPSALAKAQTIEVEAAQGCRVDADATLLSVLVRNLVDNAIRYAPPGSATRVSVRGAAAGIELVVEDGGPGMDARDMARLGARFFRVVGSGESGSGLGWSIVRRIAAAMAADVHVARSASLGGLAVVLRLRRSTLPARPS